MSKNDEWGAVAYLAQSAYGKYGNTDYTGANKEVYVNNAFNITSPYIFTTGRSNGTYGGGSGSVKTQYGTYEYNNCPASAYTKTVCAEATRTSNNTKGTGASTTGNIYGVYDMSGGAYEYVMGNYGGTISSSGFSAMPESKYYNKYTSTILSTACNGVSCPGVGWSNETGNGSVSGQHNWYNDSMYLPESSYPWVIRGYDASHARDTGTGVFSSLYDDGLSVNYGGFRASVAAR